jgi:hypothetical protein
MVRGRNNFQVRTRKKEIQVENIVEIETSCTNKFLYIIYICVCSHKNTYKSKDTLVTDSYK